MTKYFAGFGHNHDWRHIARIKARQPLLKIEATKSETFIQNNCPV